MARLELDQLPDTIEFLENEIHEVASALGGAEFWGLPEANSRFRFFSKVVELD